MGVASCVSILSSGEQMKNIPDLRILKTKAYQSPEEEDLHVPPIATPRSHAGDKRKTDSKKLWSTVCKSVELKSHPWCSCPSCSMSLAVRCDQIVEKGVIQMCFTFQKAIIIKIIVGYLALAAAFSCPNLFGQTDVKSHRVAIRESQQVFAKEKRNLDRTYHQYIENLNAGYTEKVKTLRKQVVRYLEKARDQLAKNLDLQGANEVQNEINSYADIPIQFPATEEGDAGSTKLIGHASLANETEKELRRTIADLEAQLRVANESIVSNSQKSNDSLLVSRNRNSAALPIDAVRFNGHSYKFYGKGFPFSAAARICSEKGGHLVTVDSPEELEFLRQLARRNPFKVDQFWINATDDLKEGVWRTIEGASLPFLPWGPSEPSNTAGRGGQEHYASISRESNWLLNDSQGVYRSYGFICEWDY